MTLISLNDCFNSSSIAYKGLSALSNKMIFSGPKRQICLQSSDPMEPPAGFSAGQKVLIKKYQRLTFCLSG
jgi:hypothetical protein